MASDTLRNITGVLKDPAGTAYANKSMTWYRVRRVVSAQGDTTVVDDPFVFQTDASGGLDIDVMAGRYMVRIRLKENVDRNFYVTVPDEAGPFDIADLLEAGDVDEGTLAQVQLLVAEARRWAQAPEDELVDPEDYPGEYSAFHWAQKAASVDINLAAHVADTTNPHQVTKAQVGLGNVNNTSDANKPISTAQQAALNLKADLVAGKVPTSQLPDAVLGAIQYQGTWNAATNTPTIPAAAAGNKGHYYRVATAGSTSIGGITDWQVGDWIVSNGTIWEKVDNSEVVVDGNYLAALVFGQSAKVTLANADTLFVTDSAASNGPKKVTVQNLKAAVLASPVMTGSGSIAGNFVAAFYNASGTFPGFDFYDTDAVAARARTRMYRNGDTFAIQTRSDDNANGWTDLTATVGASGITQWDFNVAGVMGARLNATGWTVAGTLTVSGASGTIGGNAIWHDGNASEKVDDRVGALLQAGTNITLDYNDATNTLIISGSGTVSAAAVDVSFSPTGGIAATNAQAAIAELDTEKAPKAAPVFTGGMNVTGNAVFNNLLQATYMNVRGTFPGLDYIDTDASSNRQTRTVRSGQSFLIQTFDDTPYPDPPNFISDDMVATIGASGVSQWRWNINGASRMRLTDVALFAPAVHIGGSGRPIQKMEYHGGVSGNLATDTAAFAAAASALPASGGAIELGAGTTLLSSLQTINAAATANILIEGKPGLSKIETRGTGGAVKVVFAGAAASPANTNRRLTVQGIKFVTNQTDAGWAIDAEWPENTGEPGRLFTLRDCDIEGVDQASAHYFTGGVRLTRAKNAYFGGLNIKGQSVNTLMDYGIYLDDCVQVMFDQCVGYHMDTMLDIRGGAEGIYWYGGSVAVMARRGIHWETYGDPAYQGTLLCVQNGHFSCTEFGVHAVNVAHLDIAGGLYQKREGTSQDYAGILVQGSSIKGMIRDIVFSRGGSSPGANNSIIIGDGVGAIQVHHTQHEFVDTGVWFQTGSAGCLAESNQALSSVTTLINNQGTGNTVRNNIT